MAELLDRNTGRGSSLQLWSLLTVVLGGAWRSRLGAPATPGVSQFCSLALARWHFIRDALTKKFKRQTSARLAFAGVRLPAAGPYDFGGVAVRQVDARDQEYVPKDLIGQLAGTDASGNSVTIDYSGDVVAEIQMPYIIRLLDDAQAEFPRDLLEYNKIDQVSYRLRMCLLLAMHRDHRVQIVPSWQSIDDPLEHGVTLGWGDPRRAVGLMPTQLTDQEVAAWQEWYGLLGSRGSETLAIAISRIIRAVAERREPVDVLIDSVIAWENLFGSSQGEPTLRVTATMALLLEDNPKARTELREKLGRIYNLRSKAVHGSSQPKPADVPLCYESLDYAIRALEAVFRKRPDLLKEKDGTGRGIKLILGG